MTGVVLGVIGVVLSIAYLVFVISNPDFVQDVFDRFSSTTTTTPDG
jgi:hypothetical protein